MEIQKLQWDSDFFGMRIGRVDIHTSDDAEDLRLMREELKRNYDLLYVFCVKGSHFDAHGADLVDKKVLYSKYCEPRELNSDVVLYKQSIPSEYMYNLALVSGGYSRFKLDRHFPIGSYEKMYRKWMENACPQDGTNKQIFVYYPDGIAEGLITVDYQGDHAKIGLVAVNPACQHQGVGTKIMSTLENYLYCKGVMTIEVATQAANTDACSWYKKNGFRIETVTPIYHWWL